MTRRSLLATLFGGGTALALDPERLLWRPGAKLISVPAPAPLPFSSPSTSVVIIEDAMRSIGVLGVGESASRNELDYCGRLGARMIADWAKAGAMFTGPFEEHVVSGLAARIAPCFGVWQQIPGVTRPRVKPPAAFSQSPPP